MAGTYVGSDPSAAVTDVVTDSREACPGAAFVAISGARVDGHDFAAAAVSSGCPVAITSRPIAGVPCIVVDDPVLALGRLATALVTGLGAVVVGITGSSGKTSTKDLVAAVLAAAAPTVASPGSFNTEVGLPRTVVSAPADTRFLVLEMGMRGPGHITYLARLVRPSIAVVTNVGHAHIELLGSQDAIAAAKGELVAALSADGTAVLNADDPRVRAMAALTPARVVLAGEAADAQVTASNVVVDDLMRASFTLEHRPDDAPAQQSPVHLQVHGRHQVSNALLAAGVGIAAGMSLDAIAHALSEAQPASRWRMEVHRRTDGVTVVNDAYNANPESMAAALAALAGMDASHGHRGRRWAVLGEMRELGEYSSAAHARVGEQVVAAGIERLVCVGDATRPVLDAARTAGLGAEESCLVPDADAALVLLRGALAPGDVVLVKASRSVGLESVASGLLGASLNGLDGAPGAPA